jgi:sugar phosphate isomerase/epimerase
VRLAVTPDSRWEIAIPDLVKAVGAAGFVGLGCPGGRASFETRVAYDNAGMTCHEVKALVISDDAERTVASAAQLCDAAETMSALWVNTVFRAAPSGDAAAVIKRCSGMFAEAGSAMAVEFSPIGALPGLTDALEVAELAGAGAGVLIDTWHFCFGPSTWEQLETLPGEKIAYIQFDDAPALESDDLVTETMDRRAIPGEGIFDLDRFATAVRSNGFDGFVSLELLNRDLRPAPVSLPDFLNRAMKATAPYWD